MNIKDAVVLVVDDDQDVLVAVQLLLRTEVKKVLVDSNPENIGSILKRESIDLLLLDMNYKASINTGNEGFFWLNSVKKQYPRLPVIMITAYAHIDLAIRALKDGAADFVVKPWENDRFLQVIKDVLKNKESKGVIQKAQNEPFFDLIGESPAMQEVFLKIRKIAPTDANILILGENGTGKDGLAKAIHQLSNRKNNSLVKVDVGALTSSLFESELFGYKKGAFTDAREDRKGRFEAADGGTLFLDEIGNIGLQQQAKLLTVLQNREVTKLGSHEPIPVNIRLVCATNLPIRKLADESRFRKDLIYRINTVEIVLPPLRERGNDILLLTQHFIKVYAGKYMKGDMTLAKDAEQLMLDYHYPGNVRELQYTIERAVIMSDSEVLQAKDILFSPLESPEHEDNHAIEATNLGLLEKSAIQKVIEKHNGNITHAAKELGLTRTALYRRLTKYNL
jgi:two-component system response regulator HydG